jgi:hypothetical protein
VTEKLATFDLAVLNTGKPLPAAIILYYSMFAVWLISLQRQRWRLLATVLFVLSLLTLFYQPALKCPTIIILPHSIICINEHRQVMYLGANNRQANKILAYYGACKDKEIDNKNKEITRLQFLCSQGRKILAQQLNEKTLALIVDKQIYAITLGKLNSGDEKLAIQLRQSQALSRSQFSKQLSGIDLKIYCPSKSISFHSIEGGETSFSSSVL